MVEIILGDITNQKNYEAIVNAANNTLLGGGGVDGAIHRKAGPRLLNECRTRNGCKTGEVKVTAAYDLPNMYIFHTVGPIWNGGNHGEQYMLRLCYKNIIEIALMRQIRSVAIPSISTGKFHFPVELAAKIACETVFEYEKKEMLDNISLAWVLYDKKTYEIYRKTFSYFFKNIVLS